MVRFQECGGGVEEAGTGRTVVRRGERVEVGGRGQWSEWKWRLQHGLSCQMILSEESGGSVRKQA